MLLSRFKPEHILLEFTMQLTHEQINYCMECGVCTGSCPVSRELPTFSPRQMIKRSIMQPEGKEG